MYIAFCGIKTDKPVTYAIAEVTAEGHTWDNQEEGAKIEAILTGQTWVDGDGSFIDLDLSKFEDWQKIPYLIRGKYFWCQDAYAEGEDANR